MGLTEIRYVVEPSEELSQPCPDVPDLISTVCRKGEIDRYSSRGQRVLDVRMKTDEIFGVGEEELIREDRWVPISLTTYCEEDYKTVLGVSTSFSTVEILWDGNTRRVVGFRAPWSFSNSQNWRTYNHAEAWGYLETDPWGVCVDRELLQTVDQGSFDIPGYIRGGIVLLDIKPYRGETLQVLYHIDCFGQNNRGVDWLGYRVIKHPGIIVAQMMNRDLPIPELRVPVQMGKGLVVEIPQCVSLDKLVAGMILPTKYFYRNAKDPSKPDCGNGEHPNFWQVRMGVLER